MYVCTYGTISFFLQVAKQVIFSEFFFYSFIILLTLIVILLRNK